MCQATYMMVVIYLMTTVSVKYHTPLSKRFQIKDHSNQVALNLSTAADIFDLFEYTMVDGIAGLIGTDVICG
jgi:hypothetical protein